MLDTAYGCPGFYGMLDSHGIWMSPDGGTLAENDGMLADGGMPTDT